MGWTVQAHGVDGPWAVEVYLISKDFRKGFREKSLPGGQSVGLWRTVRGSMADSPLLTSKLDRTVCSSGRPGGRSAACLRTVRRAQADSPPGPTGTSNSCWLRVLPVEFKRGQSVRSSRTVCEVRIFDITASNGKGEYKYSEPRLGGSFLALYTETWRHSELASRSCKIRWEKHPRAFVKVVGGSEIYNCPIHHFVHLYSSFWRFLRSNRSTVKRFWADCTLRRDVARRASPPRRSGRARAFPRCPRLPQAARAPRRVGIRPYRMSRRIVTGRTPWTAGPSAVVRSRAYRGTPSVHWVLAGTRVTYKGGRHPPLALNPLTMRHRSAMVCHGGRRWNQYFPRFFHQTTTPAPSSSPTGARRTSLAAVVAPLHRNRARRGRQPPSPPQDPAGAPTGPSSSRNRA
jgi:hypothetical protein